MLTKALNRRIFWQAPTKQNLPVSGDMFITCEFQLEPIQNHSGTFVGSFAEVNRCENDFTSTLLCSLELLFFTDRSLGESGGVFFFVHERRGVLVSQFFSPFDYSTLDISVDWNRNVSDLRFKQVLVYGIMDTII